MYVVEIFGVNRGPDRKRFRISFRSCGSFNSQLGKIFILAGCLEETLPNLYIVITHTSECPKNREEAETLAKKGAGRSGGIALLKAVFTDLGVNCWVLMGVVN